MLTWMIMLPCSVTIWMIVKSLSVLLYFVHSENIMESSEQSPPDSGAQEVNPVFLQQLRELDIPEEAAKQVHLIFILLFND